MSKDEYYKKLEDGGKLAFLDLMLGNGMTDNELRDETMTIIIGGQETTATELSYALLLIAMHPDVQELVHEELDYIFGNNKYTEPGLYDLNKLEYLERVIKESMRLFPALPAIGRQLEEDVKVGDFVVPKGTDIGIFIYETHRDPDHWKDPGKFNPDNFLPENCRTRHPYSYMPFSAGLRNCIGQKYGMLQMKTVLSTLLRRYNIQPGPEHSTVDKIDVIMTTTLKSKKGFNVIFNLFFFCLQSFDCLDAESSGKKVQ
ncbi:cytochrome P450 4C1-like [Lycorma delicatula]|uniref:cytochrome P450 4C1-like n=1 Tax=Lycorma delicatula TaxID=130591 RepID=UPI003F5187B4